MAKLGKRVRKSAKRVAGSAFLRDVLRDLIKAAVIAAAAKFAESRSAEKVKRKAEKAIARKPTGKRRKTRRRG